MLSLLGKEMNLKGHIFKPFYLLLGVLYFIVLSSLLGTLYIVLLLRTTLESVIKDIQKERNKYKRVK